MVHLEIGRSNSQLLKIAGDLAEQYEANLIGIVACQPMQMVYGDGYIPGDVIEQSRAQMQVEIRQAEAEFRQTFESRAQSISWRSVVMYGALPDYVASEARSADLIITGVATGDFFDASRSVNTGDLIMQVGRPVLVVPAAVDKLRLERMLVCWKDTRESRRAIVDALPLLKKASRVTIVEIADDEQLPDIRNRLDDVAFWLKRHGVEATVQATASAVDPGSALYGIAKEQDVDVIIAGAYGHSRMREWAFGGVTREMLVNTHRCLLLSH
jgi:nucleotide-binding universal stress UspA family protein